MDLTVAAVAFATIFLVELPDKTFIAALVLSTRFRPLAVWLGVGLAFGVQTLLAVTAGALATLLPDGVIRTVALAIFLVGAFVLFRTAGNADAEEKQTEEEYAAKAGADDAPRSFVKATVASFLILFAAEWGDLSQLLTISLVTRYDDHVSVFVGAWVALLAVSGLAVLAGRVLLRYLRLSVLHYIGGTVCLLLAAFTVYELVAA
jgi:Ca2+/H+ antiporter, TMEM165/GDT1 family